MRNYYRLMLGRKSVHAEACLAGGFVGTDFGVHQDLTGRLPDEWRDFNKEFIPIYPGFRTQGVNNTDTNYLAAYFL